METKFRSTLVSLNKKTQRTVNKSLLKYYNFLIDYDFKTDENVYATYRNTFENLFESIKTNEMMYEVINQIYRDCHRVFFPANKHFHPTNEDIRQTFINVTDMFISISKCHCDFYKS